MPFYQTPEQEAAFLTSKGFDASKHMLDAEGYVVDRPAPVDSGEFGNAQPTVESITPSYDTTSKKGALLAHAAAGVPSAVTGFAAGVGAAELALPLAAVPLVGPILPPAIGLAAGLATAYGTRKLQDEITPAPMQEYLDTSMREHGISAKAGEVLSQLAVARPDFKSFKSIPNLLKAVTTGVKADKRDIANAVNIGVGGGLGAAPEVQNLIQTGNIDPTALLLQTIGGAVINNPRAWLGKVGLPVHPNTYGESPELPKTNEAGNDITPEPPKQLGYNKPKQLGQGEQGFIIVPKDGSAPIDIDAEVTPSGETKLLTDAAPVKTVSPNVLRITKDSMLQSAVSRPEVSPAIDVEVAPWQKKPQPKLEAGRTEAERIQDELEGSGAKYSEQPTIEQPQRATTGHITKINDELAAKGVHTGLTQKWYDAWKKLGLQFRNVKTQADGKLTDKSGNPIAGESVVREGMEEGLNKINPNKAGLDTQAHELQHSYEDWLSTSPNPADQRFIKRINKLTEQLPDYQQWKSARDSQKLPSTPEEFRAQNVGADAVRRQLLSNGYWKDWFKDFKSYMKVRIGNATTEDLARYMSGRLVYDRPVFQDFVGELNKTAGQGGKGNDFERYNELTRNGISNTGDWAEVEAIKNRNGGMPPKQSEESTIRRQGGDGERVRYPFTNEEVTKGQELNDALNEITGPKTSPLVAENESDMQQARAFQKPSNNSEESVIQQPSKSFYLIADKFLQNPKQLGYAVNTPIAGEQLSARLKNYIPPVEYEMLQAAGLDKYLADGKKTPTEVAKWIQENGPKVEVRKFGEGGMTPEQKEYNKLTHEFFDNQSSNQKRELNAVYDSGKPYLDLLEQSPERTRFVKEANRYLEARRKTEAQMEAGGTGPRGWNVVADGGSHWSSVAPKPESSMPGYVEIAVVKPATYKTIEGKRNSEGYSLIDEKTKEQFPSSHNFPPNTLGFVRGYMEINPKTGKKTFHVIEVQSDWAQSERSLKEGRYGGSGQRELTNEPLLQHYERLALKAAIEHAREQGADSVAISDAETAMMSEGHDRGIQAHNEMARLPHNASMEIIDRPSQEQGMRLHYERTMPKIMEELTGEKGERVGFGEHKMAFEEPSLEGARSRPPTDKVSRKDLIFRNPDGTPKTDVTGHIYDITRTPEKFSLTAKKFSEEPSVSRASKNETIRDTVLSEDYKYHSPFGLKFLTPRFDKIHERFQNYTGKAITKNLHDFRSYVDQTEGWVANRLIQAVRDSELSSEQLENVRRYLYDLDATGKKPNYMLTGAQQKLVDEHIAIMKEARKKQINDGAGFVRFGPKRDQVRMAGMKPEGYYPNMMSPEVLYQFIEHPAEASAKKYTGLWEDYLVKKGLGKGEAKDVIAKYRAAINNKLTSETDFGAVRKAEGYGLPYELIDNNLARTYSRYGRRFARDVGFIKYFQNNPEMRKAFNIPDQMGVHDFTGAEKIEDNIASTPIIQDALRSVRGLDAENMNPYLSAGNRVVGNVVMGVGTALRNLVSEPAFIAPYLKVKQLPNMLEAVGKMFSNDYTRRAFQNNAIRATFEDFDSAGNYKLNGNPVLDKFGKMAAVLRKYQGRDLSDRLEGLYAFTVGDITARQNIAAAKMGDKQAVKWLEQFGNNVDVPKLAEKTAEVRQEDIDTLAKNFVDHVRGTYSASGLPSFAIEGGLAPFTSLSRFGIEKANTVWKDAFLPAGKGDFRPLLKLSLGTLLTGAAIEQLNEMLTNKRGPDATIKEVKEYGSAEDIAAKVIGLWQLGSMAGIITDYAKMGTNFAQGKATKFNNPLSFPLYSFMTDNLGHNLADFATAIREGEDPVEAITSLIEQVTVNGMQTARYAQANLTDEGAKQAARKENFRDKRVYDELVNDEVAPVSEDRPNVIAGSQKREFKQTKDLEEASVLAKKLITEAFDKHRKDPIKLKKALLGLKINNYQTFPNLENEPAEFWDYVEYLKQTQGEDAAVNKMNDYFLQNQFNKIKSGMMPSL